MQSAEPVPVPLNVALAARERLPFADPDALPREQDLVAYYQGRVAFEDVFGPTGDDDELVDGALRREPSKVDTSGMLETADASRSATHALTAPPRTPRPPPAS